MVFQTINLDDESNLKTRHAKQERERECVWCVEEGNGKKTGGINALWTRTYMLILVRKKN